ncbi:MAG: signal peptidase I [Crocinitomicaceae bacterium]|nr:signal peptidase I [Crocinitomicaceae bacterium]
MNIKYFYLFLLLVHPYIAMWWKSFKQADRKSWEALVPLYNYFVVFKIGSKKPWWSLLMLIPGVHLVMWAVANVSYIRRFGYFSLVDTLQGIFFPYILLAKIAQSGDKLLPETNWANSKEIGQREWGDHLVLFMTLPVIGHIIALGIAAVTRAEPGKRTKVKEWGDAILFALVAASIIRTYVFEPFQIPTGSMEKTLLVGDFLFVNKLAYGPKVPVTPLSYPLVHNTLPWVTTKSYTQIETSEYTRLPGLSKVERYDVVVFNYPSGDTAVYDPRMPHGLMGHDYHDIVWKEAEIAFRSDASSKAKFNGYIEDLKRENQKRPDSLQVGMEKINELAYTAWYSSYFTNIDKWKNRARTYLESGKANSNDYLGNPIVIEHYGLIPRPVDKRENYIKRCVGIPGDWMEIKSSVLYVNGKKAKVAENQNLKYNVYGATFKQEYMEGIELFSTTNRKDYYRQQDVLKTSVGLPVTDGDSLAYTSYYIMHLTNKQLNKLVAKNPQAIFSLHLEPQYSDTEGYVTTSLDKLQNVHYYPKNPDINNTNTDFTKFRIPKKGWKIELNDYNVAMYERVITAYEGHTLEKKKDGIHIDGKKVRTYTFSMNYYWMMGDNRYNSMDSRVWGFVPEDHIVGKASMVWFSKNPDGGVRWERMFTLIK